TFPYNTEPGCRYCHTTVSVIAGKPLIVLSGWLNGIALSVTFRTMSGKHSLRADGMKLWGARAVLGTTPLGSALSRGGGRGSVAEGGPRLGPVSTARPDAS